MTLKSHREPAPRSTATSEQATANKVPGQWSVLRNRNFALFFWGELLSSTGTQMQVVAVSWQVYQLTHSALMLGVIGLLQAIPRLIFSLVGGVLADTFDRRKLLLIVEVILATASAILALSTAFKFINIAVFCGVVLISATVSAFEFPSRQSMIPSLVPPEQIANAVSLNTVMMQVTMIGGSTLGGLAIAQIGVVNTYWLDVFSYCIVIGSLLLMVVPRIPLEKRAQAGWGGMRDGLHFLRTHPLLLGVLSLDFFATLFGSPRALLPVYASDILHVGPQGLGILLGSISFGAVALTPLTGKISRIARQGMGVVLAIIGWGICIILFGIAPGPLWLSALLLAGAGAADMVSMVLRHLLVQLTTPDEFRGRMGAVTAMFVVGGPMLGQFESGLVAGLTTTQFSVISGGVACMLSTLIIAALVPSLLKTRISATT